MIDRLHEVAQASPPRAFRRAPLVAQLLLLSGALAAVILVPPTEGAMLLVPLAGTPAGQLVDAAAARGGRLVGMGAVRSSIVVVGRRDRIWGAMLGRGTLVIAASPRLCGTAAGAAA